MTDVSEQQRLALKRLVAAYKLRLAKAAERIGAQPDTWGINETISRKAEETLLAGEEEYRVSPYPYPGLRSFDPEEGEIFFGRERNVADVQKRLVDQRIVIVIGGSGSGKSSLLRAGLLPYLNTTRRIPGREGSWYKAEFRPRKDPLGELADALVDQWLLPLFDLKMSTLVAAMGLPPNVSRNEARAQLHRDMRARFFDNANPKPRQAVLSALLDVGSRQLDEYDRLATKGLRVPGPSMMLLLDQFEEVFRPEVSMEARESLLNLIVDLHAHLAERADKGGLFLAVTMRSEELHHCAEHRGLSEVVNSTFYLLQLLDPDNALDRADLHRAIVQPARNVFDDWGLEYDKACSDAPFASGMADWLLAGAKRSSHELEHRPDQLPLLQHALQTTWHGAIRRWSNDDQTGCPPTIEMKDLPGQVEPIPDVPDLGSCLRARADKAAERAAQRFAVATQTSIDGGKAALRAAFRALARRVDQGTWARRFAEPEDMKMFMAADPVLRVQGCEEDTRWHGLCDALHVFLLRGYLSGGNSRPYDISHEALIRNWPMFREWLQGPEEVAQALLRVLEEVDPEGFEHGDEAFKAQCIPPEVARKVAMVGRTGQLPLKWGEDQISPVLGKAVMRHRWGDAAEALQNVVRLSALADDARLRAENARQTAELAKRREKELAEQRQREVEHLRALAEEQRKTAKRTRLGLLASVLSAAIAFVAAYYARGQADIAALQSQLSRLSQIKTLISEYDKRLSSVQSYSFQLERDAQRGKPNKNESQPRVSNIETQLKIVKSEVDELEHHKKAFEGDQRKAVSKINAENETLWNRLTIAAKQTIIEAVGHVLNRELNSQSKLRVAMYATAAIPQEDESLNQVLRNAISKYPRLDHFQPPAASQVWAIAFNPHDQQAAIGDDNGVVWLWRPFSNTLPDKYTVAGGLVNGLAFSADGNLLAAAYRTAGVVVWDLASNTVKCSPRTTSPNSGSYGVAFGGNILAIASSDNATHLWDVSQQGCPEIPGKVFSRSDLVFGVAISPDGKQLAAASGDGSVAVWDIKNPEQPIFEIPFGKSMFAVAFSPDGHTLAATGADGSGYLYDMKKPQMIVLPSETGGTVGEISFSPNGRMVVGTAGKDGTAFVADANTGELRYRLGGGGPGLFGVAFSADSKYLLTGSNLLPTASLWGVGDLEVLPVDRSALIARGSHHLVQTQLTQEECDLLREMDVPIFKVAEQLWTDDEKKASCMLPFLESVN
jgi:hypothetical protein